jgi:hypothetical protein
MAQVPLLPSEDTLMSENTKIWDLLGRTDPAHVKRFKRAGGFEGTAIKPMWSYRRMTEEFGPCGKGWGVGEPQFQVVPGVNQEVMVYCTVSVWWLDSGGEGDEDNEPAGRRYVHGVGGDKIVTHIKANQQYNRPERWENDDEAFKKAFTDAVTNALKMIGVGADVHMGLFDDNKYVNTMKEEFADEPAGAPVKSSAQLKRDNFWPDFERELYECKTLHMLEKFKAAWRKKAMDDGWNAAFKAAAKDRIEGHEKAILDAMDADELASVPLDKALKHSVLLAGE